MRKLILLSSLFLTFSSLSAETLEFRDTLINEAPPGATVMAAYMTIVNNSDKPRSVVKVNSPDYESVEMHYSFIEEGVAKMQKIDAFEVDANSVLKLEPRSNHLMLIKPKKHTRRGEIIILNLTEQDGTEHKLVITIKKLDSGHNHHHHHD